MSFEFSNVFYAKNLLSPWKLVEWKLVEIMDFNLFLSRMSVQGWIEHLSLNSARLIPCCSYNDFVFHDCTYNIHKSIFDFSLRINVVKVKSKMSTIQKVLCRVFFWKEKIIKYSTRGRTNCIKIAIKSFCCWELSLSFSLLRSHLKSENNN